MDQKEIKKKPNLKYLRDKDREKVKGIFRFHEVPGGTLEFPFKKYKQDPVEKFKLIDGQQYTLPLGVAKHLNSSGAYPVHEHAMSEDGRNIFKVGKSVRRYSFQSLEFVDIEDFPSGDSDIITVEKV